ncbi:MAG: hypothetical protein R6U37_06180 [Dehalococcoidia bacterium]
MKVVNFTRKALIIMGLLILLAAVIGGVVGYLLTRSPEMEDDMRPVEADIEAEQSYNRKLQVLEEEIKTAHAAGQSGEEVTITLTEEEVSIMLLKMMQEAMAEASDEFSEEMVVDTLVNIGEDDIKAVVDIEMYDVTVKAWAKLEAVVDEEGVSLQLEELEVGQLPIVGFIEDKIRDRFNKSHTHMSLDDLHIDLEEGLPVELKDILTNDGEMTITGVVI